MKGLNLGKLKKKSADKHTTTFQHQDGHEIKIMHSALSSKMKEALDKLPLAHRNPVEDEMPHYAEGSEEISPFDQNASPKDESIPDFSNPMAEKQALTDYYTKLGVGGLGGSPESRAESSASDLAALRSRDSGSLSNNEAQKLKDLDAIALAEPAPPQSSGVSGSWQTPEVSPDRGFAQSAPALQVQQPAASQQAPAAAQSEMSPDVQQAHAAPATTAQAFAEHKQNDLNHLTAEGQLWQQDLNNGHITPKTYGDLFAQKNTLGKISTGFGLLLSGMGAGLTHQPNALLAMMDNQIKNDLDAQKNSKDNAQNFLKINQQALMNQANIKNITADVNTKAYALSKIQMNSAALHGLAEQVQKMPEGSPQRAQAEKTLAVLNNSVQNDNYSLADRAASASAFAKMLRIGESGSSDEQTFQNQTSMMRMLGPVGEKRAEDMERKHFPGLPGQASKAMSEDTEKQLTSGIDFDKKLARFVDWTEKHSGSINPKEINAGHALASELQGAYRQATNGGVYKESEQNFIGKLIDSDPTKFFNSIRVVPQLKAMQNENKARLDNIAKSKGFAGYPGARQDQGQSQPQIKVVNGIKYMRGPNGEAVKVP